MKININNMSGEPIYEQIYQQIRDQILIGNIEEDSPLPSIRALAKDLRISVITTKRAYEELEKQGFIYTIAGKGCYVAKRNKELEREKNLREIEELLTKLSRLSKQCGISSEELIDMLTTLDDIENII